VGILIVGAGGHGQVVADILLAGHRAGDGDLPIGFVDDDPELQGKFCLGLPVLGPILRLNAFTHDAVIVALGDNADRSRVFALLRDKAEAFAIARHPAALIAKSAVVGPGTMICAGVIVNPMTNIGADVILNTGCTIDHHNEIGDHVHVAPGVHLGGEVSVGEGALVGIGATVMPGRRIGAWSVVGAGAVVVQDVPDHAVVVGVPARPFAR
jgi:sugar O-acyltransferase (sialic acid O-acetyltransferase NeuD family)